MDNKTLESWRFTIKCTKEAFDNFLVSRYDRYKADPKPRLIMPTFALMGMFNYTFGLDAQVVISLTLEKAGAVLNVLMELRRAEGLPVAQWLCELITGRFGFNLNHWGDTALNDGSIMHEWRYDVLPILIPKELIDSIPYEMGCDAWYEQMAEFYNDPRVRGRMSFTHQVISEITGIPIRTLINKGIKERKV